MARYRASTIDDNDVTVHDRGRIKMTLLVVRNSYVDNSRLGTMQAYCICMQ